MNHSVKQELKDYAIQKIQEMELKVNDPDLHHYLFNDDYYIIGYYESQKWLESHGVSIFDAIEFCQEREKQCFGEIQTNFTNSEILVNHLVYWMGYDLMDEIIQEVNNNQEEG
jgi:hypothetical protein